MTVRLCIDNAQSRRGNTVRNLSWKAAAWAGGAIIVASGIGAASSAAGARTPPPAPRQHPAVHLAARPAAPPPPLRLVSVSPAAGSRGVDGGDNITVPFNQPLPAS